MILTLLEVEKMKLQRIIQRIHQGKRAAGIAINCLAWQTFKQRQTQ
jgi:hypothetical protein